jgi:uncharacterized protein (PEP-CTERM system associated)
MTPPQLRAACAGACIVVWGLAAALSLPALAQDGGRTAAFSTSLDTEVRHVDILRSVGDSGSEITTQVRPGFQFFSRSGAVRGSVSYGLGLINRSRRSPESETSHSLSAALTGQLLENRAFIDVSATVGKQSISAFGQQSAEATQGDNPNLQEVGTLSISPVLRGNVGGVALFDLRLTAAGTNTRRSLAGDSTSTGGTLSLSSPGRNALVGWNVVASQTTTDFRTAGDSSNERVVATVTATPDVDLFLSLRAGRETTNIGVTGSQAYDNWGGSLRWTPTPRTHAEFNTDRRFFGRGHNITLAHRFPLSSLRFTSARDISLNTSPRGVGQPQTLYDQFYEQFASQQPDEALRRQFVLSFLEGLGLDPNAAVGGGGINAGPTIQERNDLAWTWTLRRLTMAVQAFASKTTLVQEEGAIPTGANPRQRGYNGTLSYRLTPTASVNLTGSRLMTKPTETQSGTDLKSLSASFSDRISRKATLGLNARYTVFNSVLNGYREAAVSASLGMRF